VLSPEIQRNALKCSAIYSFETTSLFSSIKILRSSCSLGTGVSDQTEHKHSFYEIHMAVQGSVDILIEQSTTIHLDAGEYVILSKDCVHKLNNFQKETVRFVIAFDTKDEIDQIFLSDIQKRTISKGVLNTVWLLLSDGIADTNPLCRYSLVCGIAADLYLDYTDASLLGNSSNRYIRLMQRYLKDHRNEPVTIPDILACCGCSQRNMNRILKEEMGTNLRSVLKRHRLNLIIELLCETNKSLKEIAELTGYDSEYALGHFFVDEMKISPNRFRQQHNATKKE